MSKNPLTIKIEVTEKQAEIIEDALEFYMRWCIGQTWHIPNVLNGRRFADKDNWEQANELLEKGQRLMQNAIFPELVWRGSYGVGWNDKREQQHAQIAYEIEVTIKAHFKRARYDKPLHYSNETLPVVENLSSPLK